MVRKILIFRSGAIGDVLMTTPLVRAIRKKFPGAQIDYCTGNWSKEVLEGNKNINRIISFDESIIFRRKALSLLRLVRRIRKNNYDLVFIADMSYLAGLFSLLFGAKKRVGFNRGAEGFMHTVRVPYGNKKHDIEYYLDMAKEIGVDCNERRLELFLSPENEKFAKDFIEKNKLTDNKIIGIAPGGAENPGQVLHLKRWSWQKYAQLADRLVEQGYSIIFFGGPNDKEIIKRIMNRMKHKALDVSGIKLKESAALIKYCEKFICNDSGPMHVAAAMDVPTIAIFGPTNPKKLAPIGKGDTVIQKKMVCAPCYRDGKFRACKKHECMNQIKVGDVLDFI